MRSGRVQHTVLIVDDEPNAIKVLAAILSSEGYRVFQAQDVDSASRVLAREDVAAVITDMKMPGQDGMQLHDHVQKRYPEIPVLFLTAYGTVDSAVHAMTCGAFYYFVKPPEYPKLRAVLALAVQQHFLKKRATLDKTQVDRGHGIIGAAPQMLRIFETIHDIKDSLSSVLVCGETGTGKELVARALHFCSVRKDKPFVAVNCAAIPRELIESELFGFERGAFSGAVARRIGRCEEAGEGTLFLDEIGELDLSLQAKLLRVLQEKELERLGSNTKIKVKFRLVCSTNRNLKQEVAAGNFREDLFYRLNVVEITIPPLRERKEDVVQLLTAFVHEFAQREGKKLTVADEVVRLFCNHPWPGNIRQLRNVVERAVVLARGSRITEQYLPEEFQAASEGRSEGSLKTLREMESEAIQDVLRECRGNKSSAAKILGISRKSFYHRLKAVNGEACPLR